MKDRQTAQLAVDTSNEPAGEELAQLLHAPVDAVSASAGRIRIAGVVVGTLVGFSDAGAIPLVAYPGQPGTAAFAARSTIDLQGVHIGRQAVMMFEEGDPYRPIVVGILRSENSGNVSPERGHVEVDADGERLIVSAKERIVLRCGKASITLTKEGKLILQGAYVSSQSSGVLRIKGGSVQIN